MYLALVLMLCFRLVVTNELFGVKLTTQYGLTQICEERIVRMPGVPDGSDMRWTEFHCRPFPARVKDACEKENHYFCIVWTTAGFLSELAAGFAVVSCLALVFGVTTHSRRRRIWRAVAALVALHGVFPLHPDGVHALKYIVQLFFC